MFETMLFAAICLPIGLYFLLKMKTCYFPALFFAIKFVAGQVLDFDRVRNNVIFQLFVISVLMIVIIIRNKGKWRFGDKLFSRSIPAILAFLVFYSLVGVINGHGLFQIFIDCYKYLEIIVYYILLRASWENNDDILNGVRGLTWLMLCVGLAEIFLTARGGVGVNLIMSLFPMTLILSMYNLIPHRNMILALSFLIVASCQTRTYIVGFALGFIMLLFLLPQRRRKEILHITGLFLIVAITAVVLFDGKFLGNTLARFMELSSGFEESGGYRIYDYIEAFNRFLEHPIIGHGFGYLKRTFVPKMGWMNWGDFVHCLYLEILFKVGVCGVACLLLLLYRLIGQIWRGLQKTKGKNSFVFAICAGGICSFLAWAFTYAFAPLTTMGSMFLGPLIACIALSNYYKR